MFLIFSFMIVPMLVESNLMEGTIDCRRVIMSAGLHSFTVHPALRCNVNSIIMSNKRRQIKYMRNKSISTYIHIYCGF